jgi:hypothetical protein
MRTVSDLTSKPQDFQLSLESLAVQEAPDRSFSSSSSCSSVISSASILQDLSSPNLGCIFGFFNIVCGFFLFRVVPGSSFNSILRCVFNRFCFFYFLILLRVRVLQAHGSHFVGIDWVGFGRQVLLLRELGTG